MNSWKPKVVVAQEKEFDDGWPYIERTFEEWRDIIRNNPRSLFTITLEEEKHIEQTLETNESEKSK